MTFSVAELKVTDRLLGFLYVTLRGQADDSPSNGGIRELISTIGVSALLGSLLVSLLAGLYVFKRITSRLQTLSSEIEAFRISGFRKPEATRIFLVITRMMKYPGWVQAMTKWLRAL